MEQILARKRKGFTLVEEAIVIAVIAILAIPTITLLNEAIRAQIYGTRNVKGQYYANLIMQDFERRIRQATSGSININSSGNTYEVSFAYQKTDKNGQQPQTITYHYEIDDPNTSSALLYRWKDNDAKSVFPVGIEKGIIQNFKIDESKSNLDTSKDPPYYIDVKITSSANTILEKRIYLVNYYKGG